MEIDLYPNIMQESMGSATDPNNGLTLLSNSSSSRLIHKEQNCTSSQSVPSGIGETNSMSPYISRANYQAGAVISLIEDILHQMVDCIIGEKKELVIYLKSRKRSDIETIDATSGAIKYDTTKDARAIKFPGRTEREAWRFSMWSFEAVRNPLIRT
jgi:hypothetical protein